MKAQLITITEEMSKENQINTINQNFEKLNELQHQRELAIFSRFDSLSKNVDGIKTQLAGVENEIVKVFNQIASLDTKINQSYG